MMDRRALVAVLSTLAVFGCSAVAPMAAPASSISGPDVPSASPDNPADRTSAPADPSAPQGDQDRPVDPELQTVSLSAPSPIARRALEQCGLIEYPEYVGGIAEVSRPSEATKWVRLYGTEPELRSRGPAVLVTVKGEITLAGTVFIEPVCFFVNDQVSWISTGRKRAPDGKIVESELVPLDPPTHRLPPLAP